MSFLPDRKIWINNRPSGQAKIERKVDPVTNEVSIVIRDRLGLETTYQTTFDTVFTEQIPDLDHSDTTNNHHVLAAEKRTFTPIIIKDDLATDVLPAGNLAITNNLSEDPKTKIILAKDLTTKGFAGFFVDVESETPYGKDRRQSIFDLENVSRIITSQSRKLLQVLWRVDADTLETTTYSMTDIKAFALLTRNEMYNKGPRFLNLPRPRF